MFIIPSHGLLYLCYIYKPPFTLAISTINHSLWQCSFSHLINDCTAFAICRCKKTQVLHRRVGARRERAGTPGGVRGKPVDGWLGSGVWWVEVVIRLEVIAGWWFGTFSIFPYIDYNHPSWKIFFRGVETTKQISIWWVVWKNGSSWSPKTMRKWKRWKWWSSGGLHFFIWIIYFGGVETSNQAQLSLLSRGLALLSLCIIGSWLWFNDDSSKFASDNNLGSLLLKF